MNKYFKLFVAGLILAATATAVTSCTDHEDYNPYHNGGGGKN